MMRTIIRENDEQQVHSDENGREYVYRKDFVAGGDGKSEFSLSLVYSRRGRIEKDKNEEHISPLFNCPPLCTKCGRIHKPEEPCPELDRPESLPDRISSL